MTRALVLCLAGVSALTGCNTQRMICPAYQSAFIFDKSEEKKAFVLYNEDKNQQQEVLASNSKTLNLPARDSSWDNSVVMKGPSLPYERRVKKDRYLLLPQKTYRKALKALQTIPMKPVYPKTKKEDDSLKIKKELDSAARSITDTITTASFEKTEEHQIDSGVYMISIEKEKFNVDQDNYMWYFRDILVLPDVKLAMDEGKAEKEAAESGDKKEKRSFLQKLKDIFKKKPKPEPETVDSTAVTRDPDMDLPDSTSTSISNPTTTPKPVVKKKKGLFGKKSKAEPVTPKKKEDTKDPKKEKDAKKEEDDGF
jgi:hypothetical protein